MAERCPAALTDRMQEAMREWEDKAESEQRDIVERLLETIDRNDVPGTGLIRFPNVEVDDIEEWFSEFEGRNGATPSKSVFGSAKCALQDLWKRHGEPFPDEFKESIGDMKKGAQRQRAEEKLEGLVPVEEGKAAVPGHLYRQMCRVLLVSKEIFAHIFAVMAWSLMCRVSNVGNLRPHHIKAIGDAFPINYVKHKADADGSRTEAKHCYANPFEPATCIVVAMAVYFSCMGPPKQPGELVFEGDRQQDRFVAAIRRILEKNPELMAEMLALGLTVEDIAAHSFRKGARSFCAGGTTFGPSTPAVLYRGGWAQDGMDGKYVRYEAAADQFIGRILAMLDINSPDFAVLAPHFDVVDDSVHAAVRDAFPGALESFESVLVACLASLIYHREWFREHLPKDHPLFASPAFARGIVDHFEGRVALVFPTDTITPTGIPPTVSIQRELRETREIVQGLPGAVKNAIHEEMEQRSIDAGTLSRDAVVEILAGLEARLLNSLLRRVEPNVNIAVDGDNNRDHNQPAFRLFLVRGRHRRVPEDFKFDTKISSSTLWQLYCLGNRELEIGPYRNLEGVDLVEPKQRSILSDMHALMGTVKRWLEDRNQWIQDPSAMQVEEMWTEGSRAIRIPERTAKGRKRRARQLAWRTHLNQYRQLPRANVDRSEDEEDDVDEDPAPPRKSRRYKGRQESRSDESSSEDEEDEEE